MLWQQDAIIRAGNRCSDGERNIMEQRNLCQINPHAHIITAIDLYSRKRIIELVNELSTYEISKFLYSLGKRMGCKIKTIQTDNGREFCNDADTSESLLQIALEKLGITHKRTRPYSPWQNGVVERSHRVDNEIFYARRRFSSEEEMYKSFKRYATRTNNISRGILKFKSSNEVLKEYQSRVA
jgi:transposase InsO family protein